MTDPTTSNILLAVPTRGSDPGTWDVPVNSNSAAIDGYFGGIQTLSVTAGNTTLTAPSGTVTVSAGPTQAQNAVLRVTGALTNGANIIMPLPGYYIVENLTTGSHTLTFSAAGSGNIVGVDQGETVHLYNDGTNVKFVNMGRVGHIEIWAGLSAMPLWVTACTVPPYLLCDNTIYNFTTYPYLGARLGSAFGGNGITTFGVPDLRGRMALPYDGTGTRITSAGSGINGQALGATNPGGLGQNQTLQTTNLPPYTPSASLSVTFPTTVVGDAPYAITPGGNPVGYGGTSTGATPLPIGGLGMNTSLNFNAQGGTSAPVSVVQPSQVTGIAVIRAA